MHRYILLLCHRNPSQDPTDCPSAIVCPYLSFCFTIVINLCACFRTSIVQLTSCPLGLFSLMLYLIVFSYFKHFMMFACDLCVFSDVIVFVISVVCVGLLETKTCVSHSDCVLASVINVLVFYVSWWYLVIKPWEHNKEYAQVCIHHEFSYAAYIIYTT